MKNYGQFLRGFVIVIAAILLGSIIFLFIGQEPVPAKAQAQELFALYFEMDDIRQDAARIFAELMIATKDPGRVGPTESIGSKPPVASAEELLLRLRLNQASAEEALSTIDEKRFSDPEVDLRFEAVRTFYTSLFEYEEMALLKLEREPEDPHLATVLFEGTQWPALLEADTQLRDALLSLATLHGLEFSSPPYDELFRQRLVELDNPIISDEVNTVTYPFTVKGTAYAYVMLNITFDVPLSDKMQVSIEDPNGYQIPLDQLAVYTDSDNSAELSQTSYVYRGQSIIIVKFFPSDPSVTLIPGEWKLYVVGPIGSSMVIGMVEL